MGSRKATILVQPNGFKQYANNIWREHFRSPNQTFQLVCNLVKPLLSKFFSVCHLFNRHVTLKCYVRAFVHSF